MKTLNVSLVIPAYNEAENLPQLLQECKRALAPVQGHHEIVLIDDASTDATREVLGRYAREWPAVRPILHEPGRRRGCHPSELEGLRAARGDVALFLPADRQIRPDVLPSFLAEHEHADIVVGRRVPRADGLVRSFVATANNVAERILLRLEVSDTHSSMSFSRRALDEIAHRVTSQSALIPAEFLVRAGARGLRIVQIDIPHYPRLAGRQTGSKLREIVGVQRDLLRLRWRLRRERTAGSKTRPRTD